MIRKLLILAGTGVCVLGVLTVAYAWFSAQSLWPGYDNASELTSQGQQLIRLGASVAVLGLFLLFLSGFSPGSSEHGAE